MLLKYFTTMCALAFTSFCTAQKNDTAYKYLDEAFEFTTAKKKVYKAKAFRGNDDWILHAFYPQGGLMFSAHYSNQKLNNRNGRFTYYYPDGQKQAEGLFINGLREKLWRWWHPNGHLRDSGFMQQDQYVETWHTWYATGRLKTIINFSDPQPVQQASIQDGTVTGMYHGAYTSWYESGVLEARGSYRFGLMHGEWNWYHANGKQSTREFYNELGKVEKMACYDTSGSFQGDFCSLVKPAFISGMGDLKSTFAERFSLPAEAYMVKPMSVCGSILLFRTRARSAALK